MHKGKETISLILWLLEMHVHLQQDRTGKVSLLEISGNFTIGARSLLFILFLPLLSLLYISVLS